MKVLKHNFLAETLNRPTREKRAAEAEAIKQGAIARVGRHADPGWKVRAMLAVRRIALVMAIFTADDVWDFMGDDTCPGDPRAMGAVLQKMAKKGVCGSTGTSRKSIRKSRQRGYVTVWRSLIYGGTS